VIGVGNVGASVTAVRPRRGVALRTSAEQAERRTRRRIYITYGLLFFNTLTFYPGLSLVHIPSAVGKGVAQAALPVALLMALSLNRRVIMRPNVFLCLVSLLVLGALITTMQPQHFGTVFRTLRLAGFVAGLWLLTPWWGRRDLLLVRCHLAALSVLLGSVVLGLMLAPGHARMDGRLGGAIWPIPPTQVAHYAAVMTGLVLVLWLCGQLPGRAALLISVVTLSILVLTHTRTALVGMVAGIVVAGLSLVVANARVRKLFAVGGAVTAVAVMTLSGFIATWLERGEGTQELSDLTGRTVVWAQIVNYPRDKFQEIFGFGLSNSSFNGFPIDSNWLASYQEQGLFGVVLCAVILLFLLVTAYFQPRGTQRALALFLITYCLIASFTEVGFTDVSPYLLELTLAASLLVPPVESRRPA
jgi:O-Antigen ligase